jgi:hypothetical protein
MVEECNSRPDDDGGQAAVKNPSFRMKLYSLLRWPVRPRGQRERAYQAPSTQGDVQKRVNIFFEG